MLRAVLLDVRGTLWPDRLTAHVSAAPHLEQLQRLLPGIDAASVLVTLREQLRQDDGLLVQQTHGLLARALQTLGLTSAELDVVAVRRALCAPAIPGVGLATKRIWLFFSRSVRAVGGAVDRSGDIALAGRPH